MTVTSPAFAIAAVILALATVLVIDRVSPGPQVPSRRYDALDGLRGYLAFFVVLHHSVIWYFFVRTGVWTVSPSRLYTHFGQSSVALFFMVTAFLFISKLIDGRTRPIDWRRLYVSRALRLVPLYLLAIALLWLLVLASSSFEIRGTAREAFADTLRWLSFTALGAPLLNRDVFTPLVTAGVTWSLPFEWRFYFALPLVALLLRARVPWTWVIASTALTWWAFTWTLAPVGRSVSIAFVAGALAAVLVRSESVCRIARTPPASIVCIVMALAVARTPTAYGFLPIAALGIVFTIVAAGNSLFGVLDWRISRLLGEMSYSIYLLHGMVLFTAFKGMGVAHAATLSVGGHWLVILVCVPIIVAFATATFRWIELPAMKSISRMNVSIERWLTRRVTSAPAAVMES